MPSGRADALARFQSVGGEVEAAPGAFDLDTSDAISADHIMARVTAVP